MFFKYSCLLLFHYFTNVVFAGSLLSPGKVEDVECITKSMQAAVPKILAGIPELGVESSDPLYIPKIEYNKTLQYTFLDNIFTGFKDCTVSNLRVSPDHAKLHYELECPRVRLAGTYTMSGFLIDIPVEGEGDYEIITGIYQHILDWDIKKTIGNDGKMHLSIDNLKLTSNALSALKYSFKNLYNGKKDLWAAAHKYVHENWKAVQKYAQGPIWHICMDKIKENINKYLQIVPLDDLILN